MKKQFLLLALLAATWQISFAQLTLPPSGDNQKSVVTQYIGAVAHVTITYNSPDVTAPNGTDRRGNIWGQTVPYGMSPNTFGTAKNIPWRAGANENTVIEFSHDMLVQGKPIKAGKYGFHIIPRENAPWTLIFSNNSSSWGSYYYNEAEDALRVTTTPEKSEYNEWLTYEFTDRQPTYTTVALKWEELSIPFKVEVPKIQELHLATIRDELRSSRGFTWVNWNTAATFCLQNNTNLEEGLVWAENAVSMPFIGVESFATLSTKASLLTALNRTAEATAVMDKAIQHPTASVGQIHQYGRQLIAAGQKEKAMEVMQLNFDRYNKAWPTHVGMARALSALGKYDKALQHAKLALAQSPDQTNTDNLNQVIEKLKNKQDIN